MFNNQREQKTKTKTKQNKNLKHKTISHQPKLEF